MSVFCKKKFNDEGDLSRMTKDDHNDDNDKNQLKNKNLILRKTRAECARSKKKYIDNTMIIKKKMNILKIIITSKSFQNHTNNNSEIKYCLFLFKTQSVICSVYT